MTDDDTGWTPHRKLPPRKSTPAELLWRLTCGNERRRAELRDRGIVGAELQIYINGQFVSGRHYTTRALAIADADAFRAALERDGWIR